MQPEEVIPELGPLRKAVHRDGKILVRFDDKVEIELRHL